jgi:serine/threonine-protein kinase
LLALQNGLIDQDQLVAAFRAWIRDPSRPLADYFAARGDLDPEQRAAVEAMVGLHLKKHDGDAARSLAAIPVGPSTRESLAALGDSAIERSLTQLGSGPECDTDRTASYAVGTASADGQRFRVLRPHARGGLGAVFVALDAELNREVALKQILDQHADDPVSRSRFLLEAQITGSLEHPGIVPIYGLGTYADGRPFYAMRFIKGDSLKEASDRFHADEAIKGDPGRRALELRQLLRRFTDVCDAISYAHARGVLHRDIKPGNIIVGRYGETLVVDWGLAKAMGRADHGAEPGEHTLIPSSASGSAETLPGSALGTPGYMSPEQAEGDIEHLGPRSDVYSLGATLYYLLAGRAPAEGEIGDVLRAVRQGEFPPPRRVAPTIDRALEAVCLKAMAHCPADRYASPRALAEDLERWMADEPVSAWREPFSRRARRWANRNRTPVASAAVALIVGVVGLSLVLAVQTRAKGEVTRALERETRANADLATANAELNRSRAAVQARYELAVEAIKTFHTGVTEDFLLRQDQFRELRDRLLRSATDFYGKLGALLGRETDPASRRALSASNFELANLIGHVGSMEDALSAHRAVLVARQALAAEPGADAASTVEVGRSLIAVAGLLHETGQTDEALATYRRSESLLSGLAGTDPSARAALAVCRSRLGVILSRMGRTADALSAFRQARADQEAPAAAPGATTEARRDLADTLNQIGLLLSQTGRTAEAEAEHRHALAIREELVAQHPAGIEFRRSLGGSHHNLGMLLRQTGRTTEAAGEYRRALEIYEKLVADHPAVTEFRVSLAGSHNNLGRLLLEAGRPTEAEAESRRAVAIYEKLAADHPSVTEFRSRLAVSHINLGLLLTQTGRPTEGEGEYRQAIEIYEKLVAGHPAVTEFRGNLATSHSNLAYLLSGMGRAAEAEVEFRRAIEIYEKVAADHPSVTEFRSRLAVSHNNLGVLLLAAGRPSEAEAEHHRALPIYEKLVAENPKVPQHRSALASCQTNLSVISRRLGRPADARDACDQAIAIREAIVVEVPKVPVYRSHLAWSYRRRGLARSDLGDLAGAAADARRALSLWDGLSSRSGEEWFETACGHAALLGLAGQPGAGISAAEAEEEATWAMGLLHRAIGMGYRNANAFRTESALDPLRVRDDFRLLLLDLAFPADPSAR